MKKIKYFITFLVIVLSFAVSYLLLYTYGSNQLEKFILRDNINISITVDDKEISSNDVINKLKEISKEYKVNIQKLNYSPSKDEGRSNLVLYSSFFEESNYLQNIVDNLGDKSKVNSNTVVTNDNKENVGSKDVKKVNTVSNTIFYIKPINELEGHKVSGDYILSGYRGNYLDIIDSINSIEHVEATNSEANYVHGFLDISVSDMNNIGLLLISIFTVIIFLYFYTIILRSREFAISKLFGESNFKIIFNIMIRNFLQITLLFLGVNLLTFGVFLLRKSILGQIISLYNFSIKYLLVFVAVLFICIISSSIFIFRINILSSLKGKVRINNYMSILLRMFFTMLLIVLSSNMLGEFKELQSSKKNKEQWEKTKQYADININQYEKMHSDYILVYPLIKGMKEFYNSTEEKGILFRPGNKYNPMFTFEKEGESYSFEGDEVFVNKAYLDANKSSLNDILPDFEKEKDTLYVIADSSLKGQEEDLKKYLKKTHLFQYSIWNEVYVSAKANQNGIKVDNELLSEAEKEEQRRLFTEFSIKELGYDMDDENSKEEFYKGTLEQKIIYHDDIPSMFSYNFLISQKNDLIKPKLIFLVNKTNFGDLSDIYINSIDNRWYHTRIEDYYNPMKSLEKHIVENNLEDNILSTTTVYDDYSSYIERYNRNLISVFVTLIVSLGILISGIVNETILFIERNKKLIAVKNLMGVDKFKIYEEFLFKIIYTNIIAFILLVASNMYFNFVDIRNIVQLMVIFLVILVIQLFITIQIINLNNMKNTIKTLKGD
ncbi:hypothetical protein [Miniphocaeibacter massiliensis]|uniref:hypothetical protein n=1 Tax=Miniphocaeibacter massiliensis TaxID=2041841 RepID=UPI000C1C47D0|nr:hypothetical protein [Miniphocaeibacter massiliensis]